MTIIKYININQEASPN